MNELVSIIMPAYNASKYIAESVDSVLAQTYQNWELIIIDDGSKDNTAEIIGKYTDKRIKFYKNETNLGVSAARNKAIQIAQGSWTAFLDSDDKWSEEKLERQLKFAEQNEAEFTFTASAFVLPNGEKSDYVLQIPSKITYTELLKQNVISCSSVLIKKTLIANRAMSCGTKIHEDFKLWLEILKDGNIAYGLNEPLLIYRINKESKTGNKLKSAIMTWNTYRAVGLGYLGSLFNFSEYLKRNAGKYKRILINEQG